jgi:hypothetical protein
MKTRVTRVETDKTLRKRISQYLSLLTATSRCKPIFKISAVLFNPLTPQLNPSAQHYLTRFFTGDFSS